MPEVIHVYSEQDSKGSLLAEVNRLHNCLVVSSDELAAMRQARDFHGANSADLMQERDRLQAKIDLADSHRRAAIGCERKDCERALVALSGAGICTPEETYGTNTSWAISDLCRAIDRLQKEIEMLKQRGQEPAQVDVGLMERMRASYHNNSEYCDEMALSRVGMTAALRVAADALLAELRRTLKAQTTLPDDHIAAITNTIRTRLLAPEKSLAATEPKEQA